VDVEPNRRRGGALRPLLTPATVGATTGFMGVATIEPGDAIREHYHPYSEEFLYLVSGALLIRVDGEPVEMRPGDAILLPKQTRHRLENHGTERVTVVFHLGPLAPDPKLGHVDTEPVREDEPQPQVGGPR
jgi:putative monooxygenase